MLPRRGNNIKDPVAALTGLSNVMTMLVEGFTAEDRFAGENDTMKRFLLTVGNAVGALVGPPVGTSVGGLVAPGTVGFPAGIKAN